MLNQHTSEIKTNYIKIGHVKNVQYTIYTTSGNNEQELLELELSLRHENPTILLTYYNKCLFHFLIDDNIHNSSLSLIESTLTIKFQATVSAEKLANPPKSVDNEEYIAFANIGFLRSLKKMILYNLAISQAVKVFGNHCVVKKDEYSYQITCIDPLLLANGDILMSCVEKKAPTLFDSSLLSSDNINYQTFVVYILPSGIRCHLFDPTNLKNNFVTKPQFENEQLLRLLELNTGIEDLEEATWVKLIPNLKHLNNQTSIISKFVHTVENKKHILWPWSLCLLQFGLREETSVDEESTPKYANPMNLLSEFLDFHISHKAELERVKQQQQNQTQLHTQQVDLSNDMSSPLTKQDRCSPSTGSTNTTNDPPKNLGPLDIGINTPMGGDIFNLQVNDNFFSKQEVPEERGSLDDNEMEIDELFGEDDDDASDDAPIGEPDSSSVKNVAETNNDDDLSGNGTQELVKDTNKERELKSAVDGPPKKALPYLEILSTAMTVGKSVTPNYSDPGAPVPINPTPTMWPSKGSAESQAQVEFRESFGNGDREVAPQTLFSPLPFHPVIKKDIDTKYGKGGKFYFDKETERSGNLGGTRATSVSGSSPSVMRELKRQRLQSDFNSDSEESDEDDESDEASQSSEEQRDVHHQPIQDNVAGANTVLDFGVASVGFEKPALFTPMLPTGGFGSPYVSNLGKSVSKPDSPMNEVPNAMTPAFYDGSGGHQYPPSETKKETESPNKAAETSNFLPLILRNINVSTIPSSFLINNLVSERLIPTFSMTEEEGDNDLETATNGELIVKLRHLKELLYFVSSNIVFDLGATSKMYDKFKLEHEMDSKRHSNEIEYQTPGLDFLQKIKSVFPLSYQVCLSEFADEEEDDNVLNNALSFLDQLDEKPETPKGITKELDLITWDFSDSATNKKNFEIYCELMNKLNSFPGSMECCIFKTDDVKVQVNKNGSIINLNSVGVKFWDYLDFDPVGGKKDFQLLAIGEASEYDSSSYLRGFTDRLINNYKSCNFGSISRLNLSTVDTRPDLEPVTNGVMLMSGNKLLNPMGYGQVNKKLNSLAELIKLDLINKTNNFEFDKPLLILFINFDESFNSILQISKVLRNFKVALLNFQVPLVQIFAKIIPASMISKKVGSEISLNLFNNYRLSKLSSSLYNECPQDEGPKLSSCQLYAPLVKETPSKIPFKFINSSYRDVSGSDDTFIHVAYERSIDKNWFAAAWSDPLGLVKHTKSWYCSSNSGESNGAKQSAHNYHNDKMDVGAIANDIWNISSELFSALNRVKERDNSTGGKRFLVLTRINSVIPDDELVHWKRLSVKYKDISLIVLSVNRTPKMTLSSTLNNVSFTNSPADRDSFFSFKNSNNVNNTSPNTSSGGSVLVTSPNGIAFHSPQQFLNMPSNFLSPQEVSTPDATGAMMEIQNEPDAILKHADGDVYAFVPQVQLPSFNSPSRLNMKTGYLIKEQVIPLNDDQKGLLVFEVNLLSCSNYWNLDNLMKMVLKQYKNLAVLNDILGMRPIGYNENVLVSDTACLVPWHINAVGKLLNYLVHIYVEE
ncbi:SSN2 [Candida metapsilosis]|uniref:Mediator of RNA polymerase II transcription subunit 13 n=1 Tax=Candida metapsilosis TaxID=273372 RepID=A0A8H7ZDK8_9ASCO|nr:SSN2 [Candida metapsilosis]